MSDATDNVVIMTDDAAASKIQVDAWQSRIGRVFLDERAARYDGATHVLCEDCKTPVPKPRTLCNSCRSNRDWAKWDKAPRVEWDGATPLYSDMYDRYFMDDDELSDFIEDGYEDVQTPKSIGSLRLYICEPLYAKVLDESYWEDDLPEDGDLPKDIAKAVNALNAVIMARKERCEPTAWYPGKTVPTFTKEPTDAR